MRRTYKRKDWNVQEEGLEEENDDDIKDAQDGASTSEDEREDEEA
jgi:hypothetical protein